MRYLGLATMEQDSLLADLEAMPDYLATTFAALSPAEAALAGPDGALAPVEQCWHLADLEREGYGLRIERLLREVDPVLADFDGARLARERAYRSRSLTEGLAAFRHARSRNLARLRAPGNDGLAAHRQPGRRRSDRALRPPRDDGGARRRAPAGDRRVATRARRALRQPASACPGRIASRPSAR